MTEPSRGQPADFLAIAIVRLPAVESDVGVGGRENRQPLPQLAFLPLLEKRLATDESRFLEIDGKAKPGFERCVIGTDIRSPYAARLLKAKRIDGSIARIP